MKLVQVDADFNLDMFEHHTTYNPVNGQLKSYLVSREKQTVFFGSAGQSFVFRKWEPILMELSRKFDFNMIEKMAYDHGFSVVKHFTDERKWFADSLWQRI